MIGKQVLLCAVLGAWLLASAEAHGKMDEPPNRSSLWRHSKYSRARKNNEDNENFCGGFSVQQSNGGKCGPCGDNYKDKLPRKNENGGSFGRGKIVKKYRAGSKVKLIINISANHLGHFEFNLCELQHKRDVETEQCFAERPLKLVDRDGSIADKYHLGSTRGLVPVEILLPEGFKCKRCVLRWHYSAGNNWGMCPNGQGKLGCAPQETFRSCSDIAIF